MPMSEEFQALSARVRNWGRWGDDDQIGTLNLITAEVVAAAADAAATWVACWPGHRCWDGDRLRGCTR